MQNSEFGIERMSLLMLFIVGLHLALSLLSLSVSLSAPFTVDSGQTSGYGGFRSLPLSLQWLSVEIQTQGFSPGLRTVSPYWIVIDVSDNLEYVYLNDKLVRTVAVSTGSATRFEIPYYTPLGLWQIVSKEKSGGQFGPFFLRLGKWDGSSYLPTTIGLHGTDEPELIGQPASHGCIRHDNEVITELYQLLPVGTLVETRE